MIPFTLDLKLFLTSKIQIHFYKSIWRRFSIRKFQKRSYIFAEIRHCLLKHNNKKGVPTDDCSIMTSRRWIIFLTTDTVRVQFSPIFSQYKQFFLSCVFLRVLFFIICTTIRSLCLIMQFLNGRCLHYLSIYLKLIEINFNQKIWCSL